MTKKVQCTYKKMSMFCIRTVLLIDIFYFHVSVSQNWKQSKCVHTSLLIPDNVDVQKLGHFGSKTVKLDDY